MAEAGRTQTSPEAREAEVAAALATVGARLEALQEEVRRLRATPLPQAENGWGDPAAAVSHEWLVALDTAPRRRPTAPRLLLEAAFLVAVAALAAAADLQPLVIAGVMALAWVVVALAEVTAARADRRRADLFVPVPAPAAPPAAASDPAWFSPPVDHTLLESAGRREPDTAIVRLPPRSEADAAGEDTAERPPGEVE